MLALGDIHGNFRLINQYDLRKQNIIQVGDFGVGFRDSEEKTLDHWNESWKARGIMVYAIRGNHDDPTYWDGRYDGRWSNIMLVPDYSTIQIEHRNVLFIGGATSVDRTDRRKGIDWWEGEGFDYDEEKLLEVLRISKPIDIVVSHISPRFCYPHGVSGLVPHYFARDKTLQLEIQLERELMERAFNIICSFNKPKKWLYGHYHSNQSEVIEGVEFRLLGIGELTNV